MNLKKLARNLVALALGGTALVTAATCDPYTGAFDFFRDDDDDYYYDDGYYDDYYYDGYYYEPPLICDEFGCY